MINAEPRRRSGSARETVQRRWRLAVLLGLVVLLGLAGFGIVLTLQNARATRSTAVLKATQNIRPGEIITDDELGITYLRVNDEGVLAGLIDASQRHSLVGQIATESVASGSLIPATLGTPQSSAQLWQVPLPAKRMPPDLKPGDHVAVVVSGTAKSGDPIEFVFAQDVRVLNVSSDSVSLWLPASATAQMEWYADHGGLVIVKMQPGTVQPSLPPGGPIS
jgi:SAF domain